MNYHRTPPAYKPDAVPTKNGWCDPKTGELLVAVSIPDEIIQAYNELKNPVQHKEEKKEEPAKEPVVVVPPEPEEVIPPAPEAPKKSSGKKTKATV